MANANTNLMSINSSRPTTSVNASSRSETNYRTSSNSTGKKENFSTALDQARQDSKTFSEVDEAVQQNKMESAATDAAIKTSSQGQNEKTQDAPPQEKVTENSQEVIPKSSAQISEVDEEVASAGSQIFEGEKNFQPENFSSNWAYFFSTDPMSLLTPTNLNSAVEGEVKVETNLMTILPQTEESQSVSMLDLLGGKTWKSADVDASIIQQNQPTNLNQAQQVQVQPTNLNHAQQVQVQPTNLNQAQQVQVQPTNLNQAQQVQPTNLNQAQQVQPTNLNQAQQVQVQPTNLNQAQQQQFGQEISPVVNSEQTQVEIKPLRQNHLQAEILSDDLPVEENRPTSQAIPIFQTAKNFAQNQQQSDNFQQNNFQQPAESEVQVQSQSVSTGGETFSSHLTANNNSAPLQQTVQTAQTQNPEAAQQFVREDFNVPAQIVEHARLIRRAENTEMVINLKPEHLGAMTLKISVTHTGALNASFYSDNAQVRAIIENSLVQLKNELNEQGLKVEHVEVYAGLSDGGSLMNGRGQQAWQQNQQQRNSGRRINLSSLEETADSTAPVNNAESTDGVDYKV